MSALSPYSAPSIHPLRDAVIQCDPQRRPSQIYLRFSITVRGRQACSGSSTVRAVRVGPGKAEAEQVIVDAKKLDYAARIQFVRDTLDVALHSGANYFRVEDAKNLFKRIAAVENQFTVENYDYADRELLEIEAQLGHLIENTPLMIADLVEAQRKLLHEIISTEEIYCECRNGSQGWQY